MSPRWVAVVPPCFCLVYKGFWFIFLRESMFFVSSMFFSCFFNVAFLGIKFVLLINMCFLVIHCVFFGN